MVRDVYYTEAIKMKDIECEGFTTPVNPFEGEFCDLGSGTGKVVMAAAILGRFKRCIYPRFLN